MRLIKRWFFCSFGAHEFAYSDATSRESSGTCAHCGTKLRKSKYDFWAKADEKIANQDRP